MTDDPVVRVMRLVDEPFPVNLNSGDTLHVTIPARLRAAIEAAERELLSHRDALDEEARIAHEFAAKLEAENAVLRRELESWIAIRRMSTIQRRYGGVCSQHVSVQEAMSAPWERISFTVDRDSRIILWADGSYEIRTPESAGVPLSPSTLKVAGDGQAETPMDP